MKRKPWEMRRGQVREDALWYKDAIIYELRVRSFVDSNGDGIGDFAGLTSRLDYLQDLGVNALWLLPICPSPGKDDGYDISEYTDVHPDLGTVDDFRLFVEEAHRRGLRVITELVMNHTSDQHPWFQRARRAPPGTGRACRSTRRSRGAPSRAWPAGPAGTRGAGRWCGSARAR